MEAPHLCCNPFQPQAPQNDSTREFADLDGVGVALQAKAAQALAGILVGQIEAPLQVLSGRLLHVQLLCILLVKEADFLPKKRGEWSVKRPASCLTLTPQAHGQLTSRWFLLISPLVCKEEQE